MLIIAAIAVTTLGLVLLQRTYFDAVAKLPPLLQEPLTRRYAVDPYIWSEASFRPFRRRYAVAHAVLLVAFALWAGAVAPVRPALSVGLGLTAIVGSAFLGWRIMRHGL